MDKYFKWTLIAIIVNITIDDIITPDYASPNLLKILFGTLVLFLIGILLFGIRSFEQDNYKERFKTGLKLSAIFSFFILLYEVTVLIYQVGFKAGETFSNIKLSIAPRSILFFIILAIASSLIALIKKRSNSSGSEILDKAE